MTIRFAGSEMSAFAPSDGNPTEIAQAGSYNTSNGRCSIRTGATGVTASYIATPSLGGVSESWLHFVHYADTQPAAGAGYQVVGYYTSAAIGIARLTFAKVAGADVYLTTVQAEYNAAGTWTPLGSPFTFDTGVRTIFDVHLTTGGSGAMDVYIGGNLRTVAGTTAAITTATSIDTIRLQNAYASQYWSEVIEADESTIGMEYLSDEPTGDSAANTGGTGTFAAVDELAYSDADYWTSASAAEIKTFTKTHSLAGKDVLAVVVSARARHGATGPQSLQLALRVGSTNYFSSTKALAAGQAPSVNVWNTNPAGGAWGTAPTAPEFGMKSIA